jgi:hypothetical protein
MSAINSPISVLTRGRIVNIERGNALTPALLLKARTRGKLRTENLAKRTTMHNLQPARAMKILNRLEITHGG